MACINAPPFSKEKWRSTTSSIETRVSPMVHECDRKEENHGDAPHNTLRNINNWWRSREWCSRVFNTDGKNIELVKSFLSHYYPKLIFGPYVFAPCAGISRFIVFLSGSDFWGVLEGSAKEIQSASVAWRWCIRYGSGIAWGMDGWGMVERWVCDLFLYGWSLCV